MTKIIATGALLGLLSACAIGSVRAQSLREWFNQLKSPVNELCCHNFDGISLDDQEWQTSGGRYQARIDGKWIDIPASAVIGEPNRLGRAHIWFRGDGSVRCFMAGPMT